MKKRITVLLMISLFNMVAIAAPKAYNVDPTHTFAVVSWNHFGFSNPTAVFAGADGTISYDEEKPTESSISVSLSIETVDTQVDKLTKEFLGDEWFDAKSHPKATFVSTKVVAKDEKTFAVTGNLTIKGITKTVTMDAKLNAMGKHPMTEKPAIGFDATTVIKRSDFGIDKYVPYVSDEVTLQLTTEAQGS